MTGWKLGLPAAGAVALAAAALPAKADAVALQKALDKAVDFSATDKPITVVFASLSKQTGVKFVIEDDTLEHLPYADQTRLDVKISGVKLREALSRMLAHQGLDWKIADDEVRIVPSEPLYRIGRRAGYDELRTLGKLLTAEIDAVETPAEAIEKLRAATGNENLDVRFRVATKRREALARAAEALPGTGNQWLDALCRDEGWTWYLSGDELVVLRDKDQVGRQLETRVSLRYQNTKLVEALLDLAGKARVKLAIEPGVLSLLPVQQRSNFSLIMSEASVGQALEVIGGATGLKFTVTGKGVRVAASDVLKARPVSASPRRERPSFFVKLSLPMRNGQSVEVFLRPDDLPTDLADAIEARKDRIIKRLRKELNR